jgi:hypothetical protein
VYHLLAHDGPEKYLLLDRQKVGEEEAVEFIADACRTAVAEAVLEGTTP